MKSKWLLFALSMMAVVASSCAAADETASQRKASARGAAQSHADSQRASASPSGKDAHGHEHAAGRVPAFETDEASLKSLPPTLAPERFTGRQRLAYAAVKEIPQTIAQLPCYCYCDEGFGHKSLHSCFVDEHAAHCAVCVEEALTALRLQKEENLLPAQIRERIVAQYGDGGR